MNDPRHVSDAEAQLLLEDALEPTDRTRIEEHLAGCTDCMATVLSFEALAQALSTLPVAEPPPDFTAGVMARIDEQERSLAGDRRVAVAVLGAVAALLTLAVLLAGPAAWAGLLSGASAAAASAIQVTHIGVDVLAPVFSALRLPLLVGTAGFAIVIVLTLTRLAQPRQVETA